MHPLSNRFDDFIITCEFSPSKKLSRVQGDVSPMEWDPDYIVDGEEQSTSICELLPSFEQQTAEGDCPVRSGQTSGFFPLVKDACFQWAFQETWAVLRIHRLLFFEQI